MTLLEAVNVCLRSTGESNITSLPSQHPQVETILSSIDRISKTTQARNWWFNTAVRTLTPATTGPLTGKIDTSPYTFVNSTDRGVNYYPLGGVLIDGTAGTAVGVPVQAALRWEYATDAAVWLTLPSTFTDYIGALAALDFASNYDADQLQLAKLSKQAEYSRTMVNADHTRYSKVNLFWSGSTGQALNRNYGLRYGRYE